MFLNRLCQGAVKGKAEGRKQRAEWGKRRAESRRQPTHPRVLLDRYQDKGLANWAVRKCLKRKEKTKRVTGDSWFFADALGKLVGDAGWRLGSSRVKEWRAKEYGRL